MKRIRTAGTSWSRLSQRAASAALGGAVAMAVLAGVVLAGHAQNAPGAGAAHAARAASPGFAVEVENAGTAAVDGVANATSQGRSTAVAFHLREGETRRVHLEPPAARFTFQLDVRPGSGSPKASVRLAIDLADCAGLAVHHVRVAGSPGSVSARTGETWCEA